MLSYLVAMCIISLIYLLLTSGLNLQYGYTGLANFGHVASFAIGAYASALLTVFGISGFISIPAALVISALAAYPVGLISQRLQTDYFAIATLAFSEILRLVLLEESWLTRGVHGIPGIPDISHALGLAIDPSLLMIGLLLFVNGLSLFLIWRLTHSPFGRLIEAIRDDEDAVRSIGREPRKFKAIVFAIGGGFAGLGGAFYAHYFTFISPDQFTPLLTFYVWMAMILGGTGRVLGAVVGAFVLMTILEGSRFVRDVLPGVSEVEMASVRLFIVGMGLVFLVLYRPQGIVGDYSKR
jgi:branched-chain amino acid transport system permease protein